MYFISHTVTIITQVPVSNKDIFLYLFCETENCQAYHSPDNFHFIILDFPS